MFGGALRKETRTNNFKYILKIRRKTATLMAGPDAERAARFIESYSAE